MELSFWVGIAVTGAGYVGVELASGLAEVPCVSCGFMELCRESISEPV